MPSGTVNHWSRSRTRWPTSSESAARSASVSGAPSSCTSQDSRKRGAAPAGTAVPVEITRTAATLPRTASLRSTSTCPSASASLAARSVSTSSRSISDRCGTGRRSSAETGPTPVARSRRASSRPLAPSCTSGRAQSSPAVSSRPSGSRRQALKSQRSAAPPPPTGVALSTTRRSTTSRSSASATHRRTACPEASGPSGTTLSSRVPTNARSAVSNTSSARGSREASGRTTERARTGMERTSWDRCSASSVSRTTGRHENTSASRRGDTERDATRNFANSATCCQYPQLQRQAARSSATAPTPTALVLTSRGAGEEPSKTRHSELDAGVRVYSTIDRSAKARCDARQVVASVPATAAVIEPDRAAPGPRAGRTPGTERSATGPRGASRSRRASTPCRRCR